ncbi:hypothetical protein ABPG72_006523 [Tetrahymena utriculariae]
MSTAKQIREEVEKKIQNCCIKKHRIRTFFKYMKNQQKHYKILEFAGNGAFAFVLKALNQKTGQTVALKIVECDESDYQGMQIIEQEYKTLSIISGCKYIVKVFSCFYLTESPDSDDDEEDDNQIPVGLNSNKPELLKVFFIIEQELCQKYQKILNELQKITRFDPNFEYISVGATGLILGVFNKSKNRHSALKIQRAQKYEVIREVGIMRDCQMPLVIQLYDCFYLNVNTIEDFVVYEVEKCSADFDQARKLSFIWVYDFDENIVKQYYPIEGACGTIGYSSPEQMKDYLSTFKTDIFSVGVCLALIDNFETLEPVLFQKALDYFQNFLIPFQTNQIIKQDVIKRNTQIYEICLKTVVFNQYKRSNLSLIIADYLKQGQPYYSKVLTSINQIQSIPLFQKILSLDYRKNNLKEEASIKNLIGKNTSLKLKI